MKKTTRLFLTFLLGVLLTIISHGFATASASAAITPQNACIRAWVQHQQLRNPDCWNQPYGKSQKAVSGILVINQNLVAPGEPYNPWAAMAELYLLKNNRIELVASCNVVTSRYGIQPNAVGTLGRLKKVQGIEAFSLRPAHNVQLTNEKIIDVPGAHIGFHAPRKDGREPDVQYCGPISEFVPPSNPNPGENGSWLCNRLMRAFSYYAEQISATQKSRADRQVIWVTRNGWPDA